MIPATCTDISPMPEAENKWFSLKAMAEEFYLRKKNAAYVEHSSYWRYSNLCIINMQEAEDVTVRADVVN